MTDPTEPSDSLAEPSAGTSPGPPATAADAGTASEPGVPVYAAPDRPRGLDAWFAPGGEDDATAERRSDERRMLRLLLLMVVLLVGIPTILTVIAFAGQLIAKGSGG